MSLVLVDWKPRREAHDKFYILSELSSMPLVLWCLVTMV